MEVEEAAAPATAPVADGVCHFPLHHLPSALIDYAFTIADPHNFYLLAVLRLVCKALWKKIPLTILVYLADVGASFCGDLPVLKWIYNTTGIAHVHACLSAAVLMKDTAILSYLRKYLNYKTPLGDLYDPRPKTGPRSNPPESAHLFTREHWTKTFEANPETVIGLFSASLQNSDVDSIKWFAEHAEYPWGINFARNPGMLRDMLSYTTYEMPIESLRLLCKEFGADIWPWVLEGTSRVPNDANVVDFAKMHRPRGSDTNMAMNMIESHTVDVLPAVFLAAYHDSNPTWAEPSLSLLSFHSPHVSWCITYGLVYTWTNIPLVPRPLFRNISVARGPNASLVRKSALLRTNRLLLRILLRETFRVFESKIIK